MQHQRRAKRERCILGIVVKTSIKKEKKKKERVKEWQKKEKKKGKKEKKERIANVRLQCSLPLTMKNTWDYVKKEVTWWAVG